MKTLLILAAVAAVALAKSSKLEKAIHRRMHISEKAVHKVGQLKKLVQEIEEAKAKVHKWNGPNVETKENPRLKPDKSENSPHTPDEDVFEGDEEMTVGQMSKVVDQELEENNRRRKRQFQTNRAMMWPTTIDFYIDTATLDASIVPLVKEGTTWFNEHTCFTFKQVTSRALAKGPYLTYSGGSWCQSYVGKITSGEQVIQMVPQCGTVGTIIHESLHALGFYHEQSRSDRDRYVQILLNNVKTNAQRNFRASDTKNFNSYIFGSVMAYPGKAFSIDGVKQTIVANDQKYQRSMGHRVTGSFADARRINNAYECMDKCPTGASCKNGGFRHPKNCNRCECPEAFTGADCSQFRPRIDPSGGNTNCGGVKQITSGAEQRFSMYAVDKGQTEQAHYCTTKFEAPAGHVLKFRMAKEGNDWMPCVGGCNYGYIELNAGIAVSGGGRDFGLPGYRDCCPDQIDTSVIKTDSNTLLATAFAKYYSARLTLYVSAEQSGSSATTTSGKGTTGTTTKATTATTKATTKATTTAGSNACERKASYSFSSQSNYDSAIKCANDCQLGYATKGYTWYVNCYYCCLDQYDL